MVRKSNFTEKKNQSQLTYNFLLLMNVNLHQIRQCFILLFSRSWCENQLCFQYIQLPCIKIRFQGLQIQRCNPHYEKLKMLGIMPHYFTMYIFRDKHSPCPPTGRVPTDSPPPPKPPFIKSWIYPISLLQITVPHRRLDPFLLGVRGT